MLRANLHLLQRNLHRRRLVNSFMTLRNAGNTNEQRSIIIAKLIDSISNFGSSGIIGKDDEGSPRTIIDNFVRSIADIQK